MVSAMIDRILFVLLVSVIIVIGCSNNDQTTGPAQKPTWEEFRAFHLDHWAPDRYQLYLEWAYGQSDDDSISALEISHHLPDQQDSAYFVMTLRYNQFAWGWDDATLQTSTLDSFSVSNPPPKILSDLTTPNSGNRMKCDSLFHAI